jgi:very-short-patch-repair endonuclease
VTNKFSSWYGNYRRVSDMDYNKIELKGRRKKLRNNPTKAEIALWRLIRNRQINNIKFRRQFSIDNYVVDFYAPELKLTIEADGITHFEERNIRKDKKRQGYLEKYGITFLRFKNNDIIESPDYVVDVIRNKVDLMIKN